MNWSAELVVEAWPPTVTLMSTVPVPEGLTAVQDEVELQLTVVLLELPNAIVVAPAVVENPLPVMVTLVPPDAGPVVGSMVVTVGAETAV